LSSFPIVGQAGLGGRYCPSLSLLSHSLSLSIRIHSHPSLSLSSLSSLFLSLSSLSFYRTTTHTILFNTTKPFCCIAMASLAVLYFILLWLRQVFSWPRRDLSISMLPPPPRGMTGHGALPVYGHTYLFKRYAGDTALLFTTTGATISIRQQEEEEEVEVEEENDEQQIQRLSHQPIAIQQQQQQRQQPCEYTCLPRSNRWNRPLGDCFCLFIWGQWRVAVIGPKRAQSECVVYR
jgi:hypothetical protein